MELYRMEEEGTCDVCERKIPEKGIVFRRILYSGRRVHVHKDCMGQYFVEQREAMYDFASGLLNLLMYEFDDDDMPEWPDDL